MHNIENRQRALKWLAAICALVLVAYGVVRSIRHDTPAGQPALVRLDRDHARALADRFNAASDRARVLIMLSPT